jgi:ribonuclease R
LKTHLKDIDIVKEIESILTNQNGKVLNHKQIFSRLSASLKPTNPENLLPYLKAMVDDAIIHQHDSFKFSIPQTVTFIEGVVDISKSGRVFLIVEGEAEDYIVNDSNVKLLPFDRVVAVKTKKNKVDIIKRILHSDKNYVGVLNKKNSYWFVVPDSNKFKHPFDVKFSHHLKVGNKVVFKIIDYPVQSKFPRAEIVEILGKQGDHHTEMHAILAEYGLPEKFEEEVNSASDLLSATISESEIKKREDFRGVLTFTIDPDTAKDFDDAISYKKLEDGNFEIGVHIADVSHYVKPGDIIDKEAIKRATSVYLVDRVVPMLPFNLSDSICSLVPNEDRLTFSVIFEISPEFNLLKTRFSKTIIHSDKRFSYEEAQEILDNKEGLYHDELAHILSFTQHLTKKRFDNGALNFESTEYKFVLDENFKPLSMAVKQRQATNRLIEELMLLANQSVATFIYTQKPRKPFVYRTHDEPSDLKITELKKFVTKFGYTLQIDNEKILRDSINKLSLAIEGKIEQDVIQSMCIRSMSKASYTPNKPSHYGLAFEYYTHFTSPIRRYPDVIVHRLLFGYLNGQTMAEICHWNMEQLDGACKHCSKMEITASEAERASIKYKQAEWMEQHIGQKFEGVITGLTDFGMFVEIKKFKCEGMVRLNSIIGDHYEYDSAMMAVIGRKYYKQYKMGDTVMVQVLDASKKTRTIDLVLSTDNNKNKKKNYGRSSHQF